MTPAEMAELHRAEPTGLRAWSEAEFSAMLCASNALSVTCNTGFAVGQIILDEAELFLIITKPENRKQGVGRRILATFEQQAFQNAVRRIILEVADTNTAARHFIAQTGTNRSQCVKTIIPSPTEAMLMQSSWKNTCKKQLKTQNKFFCFPQKFVKNQLTI